MIIDFNRNLKNHQYLNTEILRKAFDFINNAAMSTPDGRYELDGDKFFVNVQSYNTKLLSESKVEVHRKYVDIQTLIDGSELCFVSEVEDLAVISEFDASKDVDFSPLSRMFPINSFCSLANLPYFSLARGTCRWWR